MTQNNNTHTHIAHAYRREGKKRVRGLEVGTGWIDHERDIAHVIMDRTPLGSFTGYVTLTPIGTEPPMPEPQRPGEGDEE